MKNKKENKKIRVLAWMDTPDCATGFGRVSREILNHLAKTGKYDIDVIGINDRGGYKDPQKFPYKIYPAKIGIQDPGFDFHGRPRLVSSLLNQDKELRPPWDIVFTLNDHFILEENLPVFNRGTMATIKETQETFKKSLPAEWHFKTISYWPVDSSLRGNWVQNAISLSDYPVAYTQYAKDETIKADKTLTPRTNVADRMPIIYHGINKEEFFPISDEERDEFRDKFFGGKVKKDTFLVVVVARNQMRKDLPRTFAIFREFQKRRPNSFLYIHAQESDAWGSLKEYARNWNLEMGRDWGLPAKFSANLGYPTSVLNKIYNSADCILSTTQGEGFGFYNLEGFATKRLVVAPNNTVHPELFNYDAKEDISNMDTIHEKLRGIPMKCGSTSSEWATYGPADKERVRPLTNVEDGVKKLVWAYDNPDKAKEITTRAYDWVMGYTWDIVCKQWEDLFDKAYNDLSEERSKVKFDPAKIMKEKDFTHEI